MNDRNDLSTRTTAPDDWLEQALLADGREQRAGYIADDGFAARVAVALPPPATLPAWRKPAVAFLWTVAAVGIVIALPDAVSGFLQEVVRLLPKHPVSLAEIATGLAALVSVGWAAAVYALRRND